MTTSPATPDEDVRVGDASGDRPADRPQPGPRAGLSPFSSVAYRYLFAGTMLTMSGYFMQQVAQGWLVYELTGSPTWLGIVSFAGGIPMLVLSLPAGVLVDRLDRRTVLIAAQGLTALVTVVLALLIATDLVRPWHVAAIAFLSGAFFVVINPTRQALLPTAVARHELGSAIALMSAGTNSGRVVGPSLAGLLVAGFGAATAFGVQAAASILALACAYMLAPRPARHARRSSAVQNLLEGLRYVRQDPTVLALMCLQAIPAFLIMPYIQLMPVFARDVLHAGPEGLGTLMTVMGVGSVLGSVGIVVFPPRREGLALVVSLAVFALLLVAFAGSTSLPLSIGLMGLIGVAQAIYLAINNTLVQVATPDALQGRVMSIYMMTWGLLPLGSLPQGVLADWLGAPAVVAGAGVLGALIVVVMAVRSPTLRHL